MWRNCLAKPVFNRVWIWAAVEALSGPQDSVAAGRATFARRRNLVLTRLEGIPGRDCEPPAGAFYLFVSCAGYLGRRTAMTECTSGWVSSRPSTTTSSGPGAGGGISQRSSG